MKKLLTVLLLSASIPLSYADATNEQKEQMCLQVHLLSEAVMRQRQNGISMPMLMQAMDGNRMGEIIVRQAFNVGRVSSIYHQEVSDEFANQMYLACVQEISY